ncbi:hypothetical protein CONPUDRAFT_135964 [Coniophora puteana RWD-64-598 SS2]|uniref:Archaemetzincin-2 n=1 Tax=Coniophora puteana (strain RWD-64-598) TaxID=741705 RepID=A0A5M3MV66_CONPW|nr:uncharacterized protein CONPUDRAFT_135964 [Coniophora puteana RWD-64-598 SS2]EIW82624.1 hypothetical protein CONPUDRAFT_135964 [Coniophora puteana RWD-64-598 SS2]
MPSSACSHSRMTAVPSPHAKSAGYTRASPTALLAASEPSGRVSRRSAQAGLASGRRRSEPSEEVESEIALPPAPTYPGPLVLPGDDLAEDPKYPTQSLRAWLRLKERNPITDEKRTVYVVSPPAIDSSVDDMEKWAVPTYVKRNQPQLNSWLGSQPLTEDIISYIRAFFTGLPVRRLESSLQFSRWDDNPKSYIGLECPTTSEVIGIRHRADPTRLFPRQLNLNDLLDAALEILPDDAYCILLLMPYDLYEDDADDFCCGRAYGASRIAVISSARYNPALDASQDVNEAHAWPLSHCAEYVRSLCAPLAASKPRPKSSALVIGCERVDSNTPLGAAIQAASEALPDSRETYLLRVCRTATHELGHCFGLDHCVYYACFMQSTSSVAEDVRQPPYACAVCVSKLGRATGSGEVGHVSALADVCEGRSGAGWAALGAWASARRRALDGKGEYIAE